MGILPLGLTLCRSLETLGSSTVESRGRNWSRGCEKDREAVEAAP